MLNLPFPLCFSGIKYDLLYFKNDSGIFLKFFSSSTALVSDIFIDENEKFGGNFESILVLIRDLVSWQRTPTINVSGNTLFCSNSSLTERDDLTAVTSAITLSIQ
ncbi:hypothetical protein AYI69_g704 [Smittium culicis]|uniref:Uncharacterized protein n=1 Tax=Smittium culicis TaxID=133412 RepID=A0A1R1XF46_9FUNG|nr:hypothetical protein AYI69_g9069 [Smittium culicis]OMJ29774.1 hypothetical protein AYI69_g704 [Smittium culicis]